MTAAREGNILSSSLSSAYDPEGQGRNVTRISVDFTSFVQAGKCHYGLINRGGSRVWLKIPALKIDQSKAPPPGFGGGWEFDKERLSFRLGSEQGDTPIEAVWETGGVRAVERTVRVEIYNESGKRMAAGKFAVAWPEDR